MRQLKTLYPPGLGLWLGDAKENLIAWRMIPASIFRLNQSATSNAPLQQYTHIVDYSHARVHQQGKARFPTPSADDCMDEDELESDESSSERYSVTTSEDGRALQ